MPANILRKTDEKILVISTIYDRIDLFPKIMELSENYDTVIINGGICFPENNIEERLDKLIEITSKKNIIYNMGSVDLVCMTNGQLKRNYLDWLEKQNNVCIIEYVTQTKYIIVDGGLTNNMLVKEILDDYKVSFIQNHKNKSWHLSYNGLFGYVISNKPNLDTEPTFYNYSARLGTIYQEKTEIYAQEIEKYGLKRTFKIEY
jgi:hypothetical protein